ncbi:MAG: transferase 1, rSAM/selenodomain-associated [Firmicutes bacterium]|nr:transferase 1, rSAM/selenodomain-associated [Bacillota bacterium]
MHNTIVVFTKVPKIGDTKTRLTIKKGGILTPEEALTVYEGCLLDVINVCIAAKCGEVRICYNHDGDREYLEKLLNKTSDRSQIIEVYADKGGSFDECMQFASDYVFKNRGEDRLADSILIVGGDIPSLQPFVLQDAVRKLEKLSCSESGRETAIRNCGTAIQQVGAALVEGACQEGGFSVVGFTYTTPFDFNRVFYNAEGTTALDMLVMKALEKDIPYGVIEAAPDVDIPVDLGSIIPVLKSLELAARYDENIKVPQNTIAVFDKYGLVSSSFPPVR